MRVCDLEASVPFGSAYKPMFTTGYVPPERAKGNLLIMLLLLSELCMSVDDLKAHPSYDSKP